MIKNIALSFFLLFLPLTVSAVASAPETNVWFSPVEAQPGDAIELNAFVYNSTRKTVTATVSFRRDTSEIGTSNVTIQSQTAKVATLKWSMPKTETTVEAVVTNVVDTDKINVPELIGSVGSVQFNGTEKKSALPSKLALPSESTIKGWFSSIFEKIEPFRIKQAEHFTTLRDTSRQQLGIDEKTDLLDRIEDQSAPALPGDKPLTEGSYSTTRHLNIGLYGTYMYASAVAGLFTNIAVFYITIVLLILLILRYTIGRFI